jgi:transcriptional regulator with XRE-family HTH domain
MPTEPTFGELVRSLRKAAKLDQRTLAERVDERLRKPGERGRGFDVTYLSKIENGRVEPPSAEVVRALAAELAHDLDDLLALAGKVPPELGKTLRESPGARRFFRSVQETALSEYEWAELEAKLRELKEG